MTAIQYGELPDIGGQICAEAERWLGTPYRHQASRRGIGADCLGLVRGIWANIYGTEPEQPGPYSSDWADARDTDRLMEAAHRYCTLVPDQIMEPGNLLVFRWKHHLAAKHVGIYIGCDRFIHAYEGAGVIASALVPQWRNRIAGVFRFPNLNGSK